jgi:tRNA pseudouridine38-40 synthase
MVRATVGTLFLLGRHRITLSQFEEILNKGSRNDAGESMPGNALFLESIIY